MIDINKHIDRKGFITFLIVFTLPFLGILISVYNWQSILLKIMSKINGFIDSDYGISFMFLSLMIIAYIFFGVAKMVLFDTKLASGFYLLIFLFLEAARIYFVSVGTFLMIATITFNLDGLFTSDTLYKITFATFIITSFLYMVFNFVSNYFLKNWRKYVNCKAIEKRLFNTYEVNGIMYFFVTAVTVLILADTVGNAAFDSVINQIGSVDYCQVKENKTGPSLDDFINSRIFSLMIPSLTVYILSIRTTLPMGIKKR